jgi:hypothetical protein
VRTLVERDSSLVEVLVDLTRDDDWLIAQRALDLLEKLAHEHGEWIEPHKLVFLGPLAQSDKWEIRLQIVRALPLFSWSPEQMKHAERILIENVAFPQTFVRAWALDGLATFAERRRKLVPIVLRHLAEFEKSPSKALQARARNIRARMRDR